jgi:hypothetical protein
MGEQRVFLLSPTEGISFNPGGRFHGWLMRKNPNGGWISVKELDNVDPFIGTSFEVLPKAPKPDPRDATIAELRKLLEEAQEAVDDIIDLAVNRNKDARIARDLSARIFAALAKEK